MGEAMTKERRDAIRAAAIKATPGPWYAEIGQTSGWVGTPKGDGINRKCDDVFFGENFADYRSEYILKKVGLYEFIANCDPQTILLLLDALDAAEAKIGAGEPVSAEKLDWYVAANRNKCRFVASAENYRIEKREIGWVCFGPMSIRSNKFTEEVGVFESVDAAKAAAQSDYETRVRSALITPGDPA